MPGTRGRPCDEENLFCVNCHCHLVRPWYFGKWASEPLWGTCVPSPWLRGQVYCSRSCLMCGLYSVSKMYFKSDVPGYPLLSKWWHMHASLTSSISLDSKSFIWIWTFFNARPREASMFNNKTWLLSILIWKSYIKSLSSLLTLWWAASKGRASALPRPRYPPSTSIIHKPIFQSTYSISMKSCSRQINTL